MSGSTGPTGPGGISAPGLAAETNDGFVTIINTQTQTIAATYPVDENGSWIKSNPINGLIYFLQPVPTPQLTVMNPLNGMVIAVIPLSPNPIDFAVDPNNNLIYVMNGDGTVSVFDGASYTLADSFATPGSDSTAVVYDPVNGLLYFSNANDDTVYAYNPSLGLSAPIAVGAAPQQGALNPCTRRLYIPNNGDGTLSVINTISNAVVATVPLGFSPVKVTVNALTNMVYVANEFGNISVVNGSTNTLVTTIFIGGNPTGISADTMHNKVYVSNDDGATTIIDGLTNTIDTTLPTGAGFDITVFDPNTVGCRGNLPGPTGATAAVIYPKP